ncbi:hypothetical protein D3C78_1764240 [compost metagenome]
MATQLGHDLPGGHGVVFNGQDSGHGVCLKENETWAPVCQEMPDRFLKKLSYRLEGVLPDGGETFHGTGKH